DPVFGTGAAILYLPAFRKVFTRAHRRLVPTITSIVRDLCRRPVSTRVKMAARVGLAPTPNGLTDRRATLTLPGNGAAGGILTRIVPLRRRMPDTLGHGSNLKLVGTAGFPPATSRSQAARSED